jgi:membrane protein required for colicin V production
MNTFDAVVTIVAIIAVVLGFNSGLLRSVATIFGYLLAAPFAVALTPLLTAAVFGRSGLSPDDTWLILLAVFVVLGVAISALLRVVVGEFAGTEISLPDRLAGAVLGGVRILLVAVLVVVIFDRIIPSDREPGFLAGSRLRPYLSAAGRVGLQTLPPEVDEYIGRLKRERGL